MAKKRGVKGQFVGRPTPREGKASIKPRLPARPRGEFWILSALLGLARTIIGFPAAMVRLFNK